MLARLSTFSGNGAGIILMLVGIALFATNDALGKWLISTYTVGQIVLVRSIAALAILSPFVWTAGRAGVWPKRPWLHALRALGSAAESSLFYWALVTLPLADVMTFYLAAPIYVVALSALILKEKVGWRRWTAVLVGFAGVAVALGPSFEVASAGALIAVVGSIAFAFLIILTRRLSDAGGTVLILWQTAATLLVGVVLAPIGWQTPTVSGFAMLGLLGLVSMVAHVCVNRSLAVAEASVVVPYQYTLILWAILYGVVFFGDEPTTALYVGAGLIVASGLFILMRERKRGIQAAAAVATDALADPSATRDEGSSSRVGPSL